jgi:ParB/RepB/Spo0J family partition protein
MTRMEVVKVDSIDRSGRYRKQMGELRTLCQSIEKIGLLHPIVITKDRKLVAGARRLAAFERIGLKEIKAHVVDDLNEATSLLRAEQDENTCRLDFAPTEAAAMGRALEELERPKAKERQQIRKGNQRGDKSEKFTELSDKGQTREKVGKAIGMSGPTYQRAKAVLIAAEQDPETFGHIAEEMDRTGKIHPAYNKLVDIKKSGTRTEAESKPSNGRTPVGVLRANEAIDCLKRIPKNDPHRKRAFQIVSDYIRHNK